MAITTTERERQELGQRLVDREVLHCQTSLVEAVLSFTWTGEAAGQLPFTYDDIEGQHADVSDLDFEGLKAYAEEHGVTVASTLDLEDMVEEDDMGHLLDACQGHASDNPAEIYEWWLVSKWLWEKLRAIGQPGITDGMNHWWGRCCTGQAICLDCEIQDMAVSLWGEESSCSK